MKKTIIALLSALPLFLSQAFAADWNHAALQQSAEQLVKQLDLFLNDNPQSSLYKTLSLSQQQALRAAAESDSALDPKQAPSLHNLQHKKPLVSQLYKIAEQNLYGDEFVPYLYLYNQYFPSVEQQYKLYSTIIDYNPRNTEFAFPAFQRYISQQSRDPQADQYWQRFVNYYGFKLNSTNVQRNMDNPLVCLNFSQVVNPEPLQHWQQYVNVAEHKIQWQYQGKRLCFQGEWRHDYTIELNPKLQNEYRLGLTNPTEQGRPLTLQIATGDRSPMLRFANKGNVLNAYRERNLTLESANINHVDLQLWQIPVSNLAGYDVRSLLNDSGAGWRLDSDLNNNARLLFEGHFQIEGAQTNQTAVSNIFFDDLTDNAKSGVYLLRANNKDNNDEYGNGEQTIQTFTLSNSGFTAYKTAHGLWVEVRDLESKKPISAQTVSLYAKDNDILASAKTDRNGLAFFAQAAIAGEKGATPSHLITLDDNRMGYLDLLGNTIDLSDKGLSGELENPLMQSWIWFDRGVYRPNDSANAMFLLKTPDGNAFSSASIWATLIRPDGKTFSVNELKPHANGAYYFSHYFPAIARLGSWKLQLSLAKDGKGFIAERQINLASILPQQIEVKTQALNPVLQQGETALFQIKADWLYGAPAVNQSGYVQWTVQPAYETDSLAKWKNWQIGVFDENVKSLSQQDSLPATDQQGITRFTLPLNNLPRSSKPLVLQLQSAVIEPSGQEVRSSLTAAIQRQAPYVMLKTENKTAQTALINDQGEQLSGKLRWKLYRVHYNWYWYSNNNGWDYQVNETRQLSDQGSVTADSGQITAFELPINDGSWLLEVQGDDPLSTASLPIEYGNGVRPNINNAPDTLSISSDKMRYQAGETVKVRLRAPFDGPASVKLATREIVANYQLNFKNGEAELDFKWQPQWAQGVWLLANGWNQAPSENQNLRAVGLHWLGSDLGNVTLNLQLDSPQQTLPNQKISLPLQLDNATPDTWAQVAVVDEGLYQLAKASFSNPQQAFWGKKQIDLDMFDVWGGVIKQIKARQAAIRSGADGDDSAEIGTAALPDLDIDLLTYWSQPIPFDQQGKAQAELELPQFNGKVRIMAVAWNPQQIGSVEKTMIVKQPLVSQFNTPLFLSVGDRSEMQVRLHNTTDQPLQLNVALSANPAVTFHDNKARQMIKLQAQQEITLNRTFSVENSGKADFNLHIDGDISDKQQRFADIRKPALPFNRLTLTQLESGATWQSPALNLPNGSSLTNHLQVSNRAPFDPQAVLDYLNSYPYGCVEQTTSAAWNNLLLDQLIPGYGLPSAKYADPAQRQNNLNNALLRLANQQASDGGFSLWGDEQSTLWLSAFVGDFLLDNQLHTPAFNQNHMLNRTLGYLYQTVVHANYNGLQPATADTTGYAYALYVLAKAGQQTQGALLKALPVVAKSGDIYPARLFVLNALLLQGEVGKVAEQMRLIAQAPQAVSFGYANYGAELRDYASSMVLLYELKNQIAKLHISENQLPQQIDSAINTVWGALLNELQARRYFDTQSAHWLAKLATLLPQSNEVIELEVNGKQQRIDGSANIQPQDSTALSVRNLGATPAFISLNQWITPATAERLENGYRIETALRDLQGKPLDPSALQLNQLLTIEFKLSKTASAPQTDAEMMLVYALPAGFSVQENMTPPVAQNDDSTLFVDFSENRDDRHLLAFTFAKTQSQVTHRLVVRAAKRGLWTAPATTLENMYQPQYRAALPVSTVEIK
ncbi:alpha-2-macroglobulin family protein [Pasteurella testudinis]|uniref:alpha-2-macroglobulin family protein n=1 Tax=Pasteurella testudinis TaxID=761 RepID=UPI004058DB6B